MFFYLYAYSPSHNSNIFSIKQKQDELVVSFHKADEVMLHICDCVFVCVCVCVCVCGHCTAEGR